MENSPYPRGKLYSEFPTPRADQSGKFSILPGGGDPRGFIWKTQDKKFNSKLTC